MLPELDPTQKPPFNESSFPVNITEEERIIGQRSKEVFDTRIKRRVPWLIKNGQIYVLKRSDKPTDTHVPSDEEVTSLTESRISIERLSQERLSPELVDVIWTFKRIEDKLPDFLGRSDGLFRNVHGINRSYAQWGYEEGQHSDALGLILTATQSVPQQSLDADYAEQLAQTWELPFPTQRQMVMYPCFQEKLTSLNYIGLAARAEKEGANETARILRLIASDESYHGAGYRAFAEVYGQVDPQGALEDAIHVAQNFQMPAIHLMRSRMRNIGNIMKTGAMTREMVTQGALLPTLKAFSFVPDEMAERVVADYYQKSKK